MQKTSTDAKPALSVVPPLPMDPVVARNIERWRREQEEKKAKRDKRYASIKAALKVKFNREPSKHEVKDALAFQARERRAKWLLKSCRATLGEIVKAHSGDGK